MSSPELSGLIKFKDDSSCCRAHVDAGVKSRSFGEASIPFRKEPWELHRTSKQATILGAFEPSVAIVIDVSHAFRRNISSVMTFRRNLRPQQWLLPRFRPGALASSFSTSAPQLAFLRGQ